MLLVTGAAGFIGSNVIAALNARGRSDIICVDQLDNGDKFTNLVGRKIADIIDWATLQEDSLPHLQGIIHLGAITDTQTRDCRALMTANYEFSKRMLWLADKMECPMVYASSASVYGDGVRGFRENPENEKPKSPYAFSKWAFDEYVRRQLAVKRVTTPVAGARYFNVYGPGEAHKGDMASFMYKCFCAVRENKPITLFDGSHKIYRDFIYVDDAVAITLFLLDNRLTGIYNAGTGSEVSFLDVAEIIAGKDVEIFCVPFPAKMLRGYQAFTQADLSKLRAAGFRDSMSTVELGIARYRRELVA